MPSIYCAENTKTEPPYTWVWFTVYLSMVYHNTIWCTWVWCRRWRTWWTPPPAGRGPTPAPTRWTGAGPGSTGRTTWGCRDQSWCSDSTSASATAAASCEESKIGNDKKFKLVKPFQTKFFPPIISPFMHIANILLTGTGSSSFTLLFESRSAMQCREDEVCKKN